MCLPPRRYNHVDAAVEAHVTFQLMQRLQAKTAQDSQLLQDMNGRLQQVMLIAMTMVMMTTLRR
jgi:hypothetical protein